MIRPGTQAWEPGRKLSILACAVSGSVRRGVRYARCKCWRSHLSSTVAPKVGWILHSKDSAHHAGSRRHSRRRSHWHGAGTRTFRCLPLAQTSFHSKPGLGQKAGRKEG